MKVDNVNVVDGDADDEGGGDHTSVPAPRTRSPRKHALPILKDPKLKPEVTYLRVSALPFTECFSSSRILPRHVELYSRTLPVANGNRRRRT